MPIHAIDVVEVQNWARQAGRIARAGFEQAVASTKSDHTLLTPTDLEIERFLVEHLAARYAEHAIMSEEGARKNSNSSYTWVIDPLDGTTAFVRGLPIWGIALGLLYEGTPLLGVFYLPLLDDMTCAWPGQNAVPTVCRTWEHGGFLATSMAAHADFDIAVRRTCAMGSITANLIYTARGTATAAFIPKAYVWDLAAGAAILAQHGGVLRYLSGRPVDWSAMLDGSPAAEPLVAGHPELLPDLCTAIQYKSVEGAGHVATHRL